MRRDRRRHLPWRSVSEQGSHRRQCELLNISRSGLYYRAWAKRAGLSNPSGAETGAVTRVHRAASSLPASSLAPNK